MIDILYFAWVRSRIGHGSERIALPEGVNTAGDLIRHLAARGDGYEAAFNRPEAIKIAVNQEFCDHGAEISDGDEVAFFPPVTGG